MGLKLYMIYGSPPANAVLMTARALNLDLVVYEVDFKTKENLEDWFIKLNPSHTVPTLDDNGFIVWDSHAIICYLAEKYGQNGYLYSNDVNEKARIHQILNFDCGTVFRRFSNCVRPIFYDNQKSINPQKLERLKDAYSILERILDSSQFLAGDKLTIADISVLSTMMQSNTFLPVCETELPKLKSWMVHMENLDFYEAGKKGLETFREGYTLMISN